MAPPLACFITCASGGGARPRTTEPFTKAVIRIVPAVVSFFPLRSCRLTAIAFLSSK